MSQEKPVLRHVDLPLLFVPERSFEEPSPGFADAASRLGCIGLFSELAGVQQFAQHGALQMCSSSEMICNLNQTRTLLSTSLIAYKRAKGK